MLTFSYKIPTYWIDLQQYKQIGNAVPVPLALALAKALGTVLVKEWKDEEMQDAEGRDLSPEVEMEYE